MSVSDLTGNGEPSSLDGGEGEPCSVQLELFESEIENEERLKTPGKLPNYNSHIRRQRFARLIFQGETPADAYIKSGYSAKDRRTACKMASKLVNHGDIRAALQYWNNEAKAAELVKLGELAAETWETYRKAPANAVSGKVKALDLLANIGGHKNPDVKIDNKNVVSLKEFLEARNGKKTDSENG